MDMIQVVCTEACFRVYRAVHSELEASDMIYQVHPLTDRFLDQTQDMNFGPSQFRISQKEKSRGYQGWRSPTACRIHSMDGFPRQCYDMVEKSRYCPRVKKNNDQHHHHLDRDTWSFLHHSVDLN